MRHKANKKQTCNIITRGCCTQLERETERDRESEIAKTIRMQSGLWLTEKLINAVAGHKLKAYLTLISPRKSHSNFKHQLHGARQLEEKHQMGREKWGREADPLAATATCENVPTRRASARPSLPPPVADAVVAARCACSSACPALQHSRSSCNLSCH